MIISEIQSEIGHCSCDSAKFKAPADFSHRAILCMTLSLSMQSLLLSVRQQNVIYMYWRFIGGPIMAETVCWLR